MTQKIDLELRIKEVLEEPRDFQLLKSQTKNLLKTSLIMIKEVFFFM